MQTITDQASTVKLALSRRLEQMILELREVRSVAGKLQRRVIKLQEQNAKLKGHVRRYNRSAV